jgi:alkylation response protein AidB-like acyl-CoA dehydrogenase
MMSNPLPTPAAPPLLYNATQHELRETLRRLLDKHSGTNRVLQLIDSNQVFDAQLWNVITQEMGLAGLLVPTGLGGEEATPQDAAIVMAELGRATAAVPYLASAVLATTALTSAAADGSSPSADALHRLVNGEIGTLAVPGATSPFAPLAPSAAVDDNGMLSGLVPNVLAGDCANFLVVPAAAAHGIDLFLLEADSTGLAVTRRTSLDPTRPVADIALDHAVATPLTTGGRGRETVVAALETGALMLASESVGIAEWALEEAVTHLKVRHQFGKPIGSYQTLRHRTAQAWISNTQAHAIAIYAAACAAGDLDDRLIALALAKSYCAANALSVTEDCLQLHGGTGFTWESGVHLHLKRALANTVLLGTKGELHAALGSMIDLAPPTLPGPVNQHGTGDHV